MKKTRRKMNGSLTLFSNPLSESESESDATSTHHFSNKENINNLNLNLSSSSLLKPSSLHFCMQINDPLPLHSSNSNKSFNIWDSEPAAPASSWSTLPNKSLICRPLPIDIGSCTCVIVKETTPHATFFSLYTYEGQGRQNRKLAVAHHKRRPTGRSHFTVAQNLKGLFSSSSSTSEHTFLGTVTANLTGSKYHIWDQGYNNNNGGHSKQRKPPPLGVVEFVPTIGTCAGSHRSIKAYLPNHQSTSFKNTKQVQHIKGMPMNWEDKLESVHQLYSRVPIYNKVTKQFELDFRDKGRRPGLRIQPSVKNFQLTLEENERHTILQLGRVGKSNFVMDYRYPLTGYQAFCICLASIDAKLCCIV